MMTEARTPPQTEGKTNGRAETPKSNEVKRHRRRHQKMDLAGQEGEDDDDEGGGQSDQPRINLTVTISKGEGPSLEFNCSGYADDVRIDVMAVKEGEPSADHIGYEGPDFNDLDENLQKGMHKYLEVRGIKASLSNFLHEYMINKDSKEYIRWLQNVKAFVEK